MRRLRDDRLPPDGGRSALDLAPHSCLSGDLASCRGQRIDSAPPRLRQPPDSRCRGAARPGTAARSLIVALLLALAPHVVAAESLLCRIGKRQSPIDIVAAVKGGLPALDFRYRAAPLRFANDGHTLRVRIANDSRLWIGKEAYRLEQLHFHTPGGDRIDGEEFPLAAHLLHRNDAGQLLGVVVLFRRGAGNPVLAAWWPRIPAHADGDHWSGEMIDAGQLLPANRAYYRYDGSLTASPCTEGVVWLVMKQPLEVSSEQLAYWRARFADNMRGPQPVHGRIVQEGPSTYRQVLVRAPRQTARIWIDGTKT